LNKTSRARNTFNSNNNLVERVHTVEAATTAAAAARECAKSVPALERLLLLAWVLKLASICNS
jgi:hypothetical protein